MQIKSLLLAPLVASGLVAAAPSKSSAFEIVAIAPGSGVHLEALQAGRNSFFLKLPNEKATCSATSDNIVTLQLVGDELFLYKSGTPTQRAFVDRSGMGQGVFQYADVKDGIPRNAETKGWKIDSNGKLTFDNSKGFIACPGSISNSWGVWVDVGIAQPGFGKGCKPFSGFTIKTSKPNSCTYTKQQ